MACRRVIAWSLIAPALLLLTACSDDDPVATPSPAATSATVTATTIATATSAATAAPAVTTPTASTSATPSATQQPTAPAAPPPAPASAPPTAVAPPPAPVIEAVAIAGFAYSRAVTIPRGSTVVWTNSDSVQHDVQASDGSFHSALLSTAATFSHRFDQPGVFPYMCSVHPFMTQTVTVQ